MTSDRVSDKRLAEMLAGLEDVTPGPWDYRRGNKYVAGFSGSVNARQVAVIPDGNLTNKSSDFHHIARCDPDTMRSILTELQHLRSPVTVSDAMVEALRGLILCKDLFDASDRTPADAYYILAKQDGTWGNARSTLTAALVPSEQHPDDLAVDRFAAAMKAKMAKKRAEGRGGWERKDECSAEFLSQLLREHVEKGDPLDVGNLAMMLHQRGETIAPTPGGDNRVVAWHWKSAGGMEAHTFDKPKHYDGLTITPLVPLSSLEAVERERAIFELAHLDAARRLALTHAELKTAKASLAAAREALKPIEDLPKHSREDDGENASQMATIARAALAGSNPK